MRTPNVIYSTPVQKLNQPDDSHKALPLPSPSGAYPYHLQITDIIPALDSNRMTFNMVGDTGGRLRPQGRELMVAQINAQYQPNGFIYHLGDLVYHFGEAEQYANQFFKPFEQYPGPIFAIPGNHDCDVNPGSAKPYRSLAAFTSVFCDQKRQSVVFSENSQRKSMVQPNVFWTLETPLATFIGMHTNVPKYGVVTSEQLAWVKNELLTAPKNKILILCLHHAPYSADTNHGSSLNMIAVLNQAFSETGIYPDIVFSGHVHNYQRFHKTYPNGKVVPFIVCGAGGFDELHGIATLSDDRFQPITDDSVKLQNFEDTAHGFLRIDIQRNGPKLVLTGQYYSLPNNNLVLTDKFAVEK
jgi:predicted phosphodiesterase